MDEEINKKMFESLKLQLFANGVDDGEKKDVITLTEAELNAKLQSESDKRVQQALETAKQKWEQEYNTRLTTEKAEAEKLAKLSTEEKMKFEFDKEKNEFTKLKAEFVKKQLIAETATQLATEGLPAQFAHLLAVDTAEATKSNLDAFKTEWQKALETEVNKRLGQATTTVKAGEGAGGITLEQFTKMTYGERAKLSVENAELYKQLSAEELKK